MRRGKDGLLRGHLVAARDMAGRGNTGVLIPLGDILADSGYAHRTAEGWAIPLRAVGAALIQDLHPDDRGPHGTHAGAIFSSGTLYCPATPRPLLAQARSPATPPRTRPRRTISRPPKPPATNSGK